MPTTCTKLRRLLRRPQSISLVTGRITAFPPRWITEPCGAPLLTDGERQTGICSSCASGWACDVNYPAGDQSCDEGRTCDEG
jgi:hypothetical protein